MKKSLASSSEMKAANQLRKDLANQYDVPLRFVNFGDCMKVAQGRKTLGSVRNCFGWSLNSIANELHRYMLCDGEAPVAMFMDDLVQAVSMKKSYITAHIQKLKRAGHVYCDGGIWFVTDRPFPKPSPSWA